MLRDFRIPVQEVYLGRRGSLPRTTSGKVRRLDLPRRTASAPSAAASTRQGVLLRTVDISL
ncbi:hypothetical protein B7P34_05610 [Streptosporangium nondiastaticum]|uniref:Uncharacterized protein n=1 Tax=Streptosporangium nondiastaticum TaxID=35764 RepID=A0A9X7JU39_9ACTN|nr:hypothetical protein B7P34_05610 [Streptosporangium nondiastaticum]